MAIDLPPTLQTPSADLDAEALFEEAREIERRRRRRRRAGVSLMAGVALAAAVGFSIAGGGGGPAPARHGSGGANPLAGASHEQPTFTGTIASSGSVCMPASQPATAGDPPPGQCVTILPNGQRYQCPIGVENSFGANASEAATNQHCRGVAPPTLPSSWRPTLVRMRLVQTCLQRAGLSVGGGAIPPSAQRAYPHTPIAALLIAGLSPRPTTASPAATGPTADARPGTVSFYITVAQARQAYERTWATVRTEGRGMTRDGRVVYTWADQVAGEATSERGCVRAD
jgi:hypothetical protein